MTPLLSQPIRLEVRCSVLELVQTTRQPIASQYIKTEHIVAGAAP